MCLFSDPDDVARKIKLNATVDNLLEKYGVPRKDVPQAKQAEVAAEVANPLPPPPPTAKPGRKAGKQAAMAKGASKGAPAYGRTRSGR